MILNVVLRQEKGFFYNSFGFYYFGFGYYITLCTHVYFIGSLCVSFIATFPLNCGSKIFLFTDLKIRLFVVVLDNNVSLLVFYSIAVTLISHIWASLL